MNNKSIVISSINVVYRTISIPRTNSRLTIKTCLLKGNDFSLILASIKYSVKKKMILSFLTCWLICSLVPLPQVRSTCLEGEYYDTNFDECQHCPKGHYCPDGLKEVPCKPGTYSNMFGQAKCRRCPQGRYTIYEASLYCESALPGEYSSNNSVLPTMCSPGSYTDLPEQIQCRQCRKGWYQADEGRALSTRTDLSRCNNGTRGLPTRYL